MEVDSPGGDAFSTEALGKAGVTAVGNRKLWSDRRRNSGMSDHGHLGAQCPRTTDTEH